MFGRIEGRYKIRLARVVIILPLVVIVFFQSLSSERLILRISATGEFNLITEESIEQLKPAASSEMCCLAVGMRPMACCSALHIDEPVKTSVCCSDILLGGGISPANSQDTSAKNIINSARYESLAFVLPAYNSKQFISNQYLTCDPPGFVRTIVLRL